MDNYTRQKPQTKKVIASSPGRINLIGEHTDYNDGFVLPAAIDKKTTVELELNGKAHECRIIALNLGKEFTFDLRDFSPVEEGWPNYLLGVVREMQLLGAQFLGFDCRFKGNIPLGSGMSSSAALECSMAFGLNELFGLGFDRISLVKLAQLAEHHFVGTRCGIMDQFASVMGKKNQVILLDCRSLEYQYYPLDLGEFTLLLLNTNVSHTLASSEYNTRREECEAGVKILQNRFPEVKSLRDATLEMLASHQDQMSDTLFRRCRHVITENKRVLMAAEALQNKDHRKLGQLIFQSHESLQHDYEVSCPELDFLVELSRSHPEVLGSRMMGGGFGGCTLNIVKKTQLEAFRVTAANAYRRQFGIELTPYQVAIGDGTTLTGSHLIDSEEADS